MAVEGFIPSQAYPISNFIILICALCTFYVGYKDKRRNPQNSFVDYDFSLIFCPTLLLGTKFGAIFNKLLSSLLLSLGLIALVTMSTIKTYRSAVRQRNKEDALPDSTTAQLIKVDYKLMQEVNKSKLSVKVEKPGQDKSHHDNSFRWDRIKYLTLFVVLVVIDQLLEGNSNLNSIIEITRYLMVLI